MKPGTTAWSKKRLLRAGIELAERTRDEVGCVGVLVDAKQPAVTFCRELGFEEVVTLEGASRARPATTPMFLRLGSVPPRAE